MSRDRTWVQHLSLGSKHTKSGQVLHVSRKSIGIISKKGKSYLMQAAILTRMTKPQRRSKQLSTWQTKASSLQNLSGLVSCGFPWFWLTNSTCLSKFHSFCHSHWPDFELQVNYLKDIIILGKLRETDDSWNDMLFISSFYLNPSSH